ncbi:hypothetical protein ACTQ5J_09430 [Fundicoccus sp. Sow4_F4]|uniref:hypothetical protein n=1 Tax=Fundicoccus sp. Sow4_F4 TaxID=3438783 RepID=UPI003F914405
MNYLFNSAAVEKEALKILQEFDKARYRDAFISDKPDIQNVSLGIGTEVTTVEYNKIVLNFNMERKNIIEYHKMKKSPKLKKIKFKFLQELPENHELLKQFFSRNPVYENKLKLPMEIENLESLRNTPDNSDVYFTSDFMMQNINEKFEILLPPPSTHWMGTLSSEMMKALYIKEEKLINYRKFNEINLFINNSSGSVREIEDVKIKVMEYNKTEGCQFNRIYITDGWTTSKVHEIILNN